MITLGQYAFWPYMHREILNKTAKCKSCTFIGKKLKQVIRASKWNPNKHCSEPSEEIQLYIGGPVTNEKDKDIHFLACIDCFSKKPAVEFLRKYETNVFIFLGY